MAKSKSQSIPKFTSLDQLVEFFDSHDMGEYWEDLPEVHFEIDIRRKTHFIALDDDLVEKVAAIARAKRVPSRTLINGWLREKILEQKVTAWDN